MAKLSEITVYRFRLYDISSDEKRKSRRWATLKAIMQVGGEALIETATEVDAAVVETEIPGMTERDFNPQTSGLPANSDRLARPGSLRSQLVDQQLAALLNSKI